MGAVIDGTEYVNGPETRGVQAQASRAHRVRREAFSGHGVKVHAVGSRAGEMAFTEVALVQTAAAPHSAPRALEWRHDKHARETI